jgi:hypothetical protein
MRRLIRVGSLAAMFALIPLSGLPSPSGRFGAGASPAFGQDAAAGKSAPAKESEELKLAEGRIILTKPASWRTVKPKSNIIQYEFQAPIDAKETSRITIMSASGGIDANIKRWVGQFDGLTESDADVTKKEIDKTTAHIVELEGTYKESMGGPFAPGGQTKKMENYAMLGAILELADGSTVFIKMTGPQSVVADEKEAFLAMIDGLKNK